mgnify:CR=1 FL=1
MDPLIRTSLIVFGVVAIKALLFDQWNRFKARQASQPIPMRFVDGVYRAWGPVEKVQHYGWRLTQLWLLCMLALLGALVYAVLSGRSIS